MELENLPTEYNKMLIALRTPRNRKERRAATFEGIRIIKKLAPVTDSFYKQIADPVAFNIYDAIFKAYMAAWKKICTNVVRNEKPLYYAPKSDYFFEAFKTENV